MSKKIKIQVWTDLYYARFIAIWRPEEAEDYVAPEVDTRSDQEINVPYLLVTSSVFEGRSEVIGANPVAPSQHPMPAEFLEQQTRHISYMFANEFGIFKPATKAIANSFLAKMTVNYKLDKEIEVVVSPANGNITLKDFRDSLVGYTDTELEKIKVMTIGEHPDDAHAKGIEEYIHTPKETTTEQYIAITKLTPVYELNDPYIDKSTITTDTIAAGTVPGTEDADMTIVGTEQSLDAIATNAAEQTTLETFDAMTEPLSTEDQMAADTAATVVVPEPTKEEVQAQAIKDLQAELDALKNPTSTPGAV